VLITPQMTRRIQKEIQRRQKETFELGAGTSSFEGLGALVFAAPLKFGVQKQNLSFHDVKILRSNGLRRRRRRREKGEEENISTFIHQPLPSNMHI
jgi:hypothetical protein